MAKFLLFLTVAVLISVQAGLSQAQSFVTDSFVFDTDIKLPDNTYRLLDDLQGCLDDLEARIPQSKNPSDFLDGSCYLIQTSSEDYASIIEDMRIEFSDLGYEQIDLQSTDSATLERWKVPSLDSENRNKFVKEVAVYFKESEQGLLLFSLTFIE